MISFIIPTLNEEKTLPKTLECLKGYIGPSEIIVSDGKSTDRTVEIARRFGAKVVLDEGSARQTIAGGRNGGATAAAGDLLLFLDADVYIPDINNFFRIALGRFQADPRLLALTVYYRVFPELATLADRVIFRGLGWWWKLLNWLGLGGASGEFQLIRAAAFRQAGGYNAKLVAGEDSELFWRLARIGRTRFESSLFIYHTGRRAHKIGWPRLLWEWNLNGVWYLLFRRSASREWVEIR
ncbi:MAG: glycosyltransferase [Candidatus Vogelbacteria bacterium]|nr:glycosyltransferase [Candidatus Vogelbacteria bacterium]